VVLAIETARFNYAYARVGLTGDGGSTFFLPRLVGLRQAKEILLLDDPIGAEEAVELGIATEAVPVADFEDRVRDVASTLAAGPKFAFGATKRLMTESYARDLPSQLAAETETIVDATRTEDFARGHGAFFENGSAEFIGR
jgi:2-(1,2-epoxy-1,2-dihydrophenyl)acetyl-CoA isomerase